MKALICASGELGYTTLKAISSKISIVGILTDFSSVKIIDWADENKLPILIGNPRKDLFSQKVQSIGPFDILLSINYLFIIEKHLIELPRIIAINIHGSKLPKYRGRAPHIWALINGEKSLGITVHQIDEGCDTGDIILQKEIELSNHITGGEVLKIFEREYPILLTEVLRSIEASKIKFVKQNHLEATVFGKRQPGDGEVSWDWDSKRILNWTRALTAPYPGAFTFLRGKKIFIWNIEESDLNPDTFEKNGKIVKVTEDALFIKIPDKILKITHFSQVDNLKINVGDIFQGENSL
ncbi:MAG: methionyl-tRNA formyltransferase [Bacteriovorax sp.]|nr:methionyl-tRNA formyltransferase [Bacteriovorax sp.]